MPATPLALDAKDLFKLLTKLPASHRRYIRTDKSAAEIGAALSEALEDESASSNVHSAVRALIARNSISFKDKGKIDWDAVSNTAGTIVQGNELTYHGTGPAIDVLGLLHGANQNAKNLVTSMFDRGRLKMLLNEAESEEEISRLADVATLMLLQGADVTGPNGKSWDQVLQEHESFVKDVDTALSWYRPSQRTMIALDARTKAPSFVPVIQALARLNVTENASAHIAYPWP